MSSKSPGVRKRMDRDSDSDSTSPSHIAAMLLLSGHGMYVLGITGILIGVGLGTTGIMNVIVNGLYANTVAGLWSGLFTVVNSFAVLVLSLKPILKQTRLKVVFTTTCLTAAAHVATFTIACIAIFYEYHYIANQMRYACDRDPGQCTTAVDIPNNNGNNVNPNYNPYCKPDNPNCNIAPSDEINYSPSCWYAKMQEEILQLYNYYKYTFRFSYACDALQLLFCAEMAAIDIGLLTLLGYCLMQISDEDNDMDEASLDSTCIGKNVPLPKSANTTTAIATTTASGNPDSIYVNLPGRTNLVFSPQGSIDALTVAVHGSGDRSTAHDKR